MNKSEILKLSLNIIVIYLIVINIITIINKVLFPTNISSYLMAPNILMVIIGTIIWLILSKRESNKNNEIKYFALHIVGLIIITNGIFEFINLVWEKISCIIDSPQIMINSMEISKWEDFLIVLPDMFPGILVYLLEIGIGILLFIASKKFIEKNTKVG